MPAFGRSRWMASCHAVGARPPDDLHARLIDRYSEPHRAYHTLQHLAECFAAFDEAVELAVHPAEIELALWFHDAIYDTKTSDNEERSAAWARTCLLDSGTTPVVAERVESLVLATKHAAPYDDADTKLLIDVDLSILGSRPERFDEYERQVRREYAWVPEDAFRGARRRILAGFLARPNIYGTAFFSTRLERPARENLTRSLQAMSGDESNR